MTPTPLRALAVLMIGTAAASTTDTVPGVPDLTGAEPQVAAVIRRANDDLRQEPTSAARWGHYASVLDVHMRAVIPDPQFRPGWVERRRFGSRNIRPYFAGCASDQW